MGDFNISVLSTLDIDSKSSKTAINRTITSLQDNIKNIKVKLEVDETASGKNALRVRANSVIKEVGGSDKLNNLKIAFDIDKTASIRNIKAKLSEINKDFKGKVNVQLNAQLDKGSKSRLREEAKLAAQAANEGSKAATSGIDLSKPMNLSKPTQQLVELQRLYGSVIELENALAKTTSSNSSYRTKAIKDEIGIIKGYEATLEKLDDKQKVLHTQKFTYAKDDSGNLRLQNQTEINNVVKQGLRDHLSVIDAINKENDRIDKQHALGKLNVEQVKKLKAEYQQLKSAAENSNVNISQADFDKTHQSVQKNIQAYEYQNKMLKQQKDLLSQLERAERRLAESIDKNKVKQLREQINGIGNETKGFGSNAAFEFSRIHSSIRATTAEAERATRSQMGVIESFRQAMVKFPVWMGATTLFFGAVRSARLFMDTITEIDSKMITLSKVMGADTDLSSVFKEANDAALQYGQTISGVLDVYAEFARQGERGADIGLFGDAALIAANVGEIDAKQAAEYLTSMAAQWETTGKEALGQVDSLNEISNNYATTVEKLAQGQAKAGATAKSMGLSFDETNAIIGMLTAKTKQSGDEIGNFLKAVLPKLYVGTGKTTIESLGISLKDSNGEMKNAISLLEEVAQKTQGIDKDQQAAIVRGLGGTYHYQRMQILLDDLSKVDSKYKEIKKTSENSAGSSLAENAKYMESLEAKINKAKVAIEQFAVTLGEAAVKSGMLDGLRMFISLMTEMTNLVGSFGSTAPVFGLVGTAIALFSKNVRNGFRSARTEIAEYILQTQKLTAARDVSGNVRGFSPIDPAAKGASTTLVNLDKAQKNVTLSAVQSSGALTKASAATTTVGISSNIAKTAVAGLGMAFRSLLAATGVGIAIAGVSFALDKIIGSFNEAAESAEKYEQQQNSIKQAINGMSSTELDSIIDSYDELTNKMNSGTSFNTEEAEKYKSVTGELANIFPELVTGENKYGKALSGNAEAIRGRVDILREQLALEKEIADQAKIKENNELIEAKDKEATKFKEGSLFKNNPLTTLQNEASTNFDGGSDNVAAINKRIEAIKTEEQARKVLKDVTTAMSEAQKNNDSGEIEVLNQKKAALDEYISKISQGSNAQHQAIQLAMANYNTEIQSIKNDTYTIGQAGTAVMSTLGTAVASVSSTGKEASDTFKILNNELAYDSGFVEKMSTYESSLEAFKDAQGTDQEADALNKLLDSYSAVSSQMLDVAEKAGIKGEAFNALKQSIESTIETETGYNIAVDKTGRVILDTTKALDDNTDATKRNNDVKLEGEEAAKAQQEANDELAKSMKDAASTQELIGKAMSEMNEGEISWNTLSDLAQRYGVDVLAIADNEAALADFLQKKRKEEASAMDKHLQQKLQNSEEYYKQVAGQGSKLANHLRDTYGIDTKNYATFTELKGAFSTDFNKMTDAQQADAVNLLSDKYGVDLKNFSSLAEQKKAIEEELMAILVDEWNDYISQLDGKLKSFSKQYKGREGMKQLKKDEKAVYAAASNPQAQQQLMENPNSKESQILTLGAGLNGLEHKNPTSLSGAWKNYSKEVIKAVDAGSTFNNNLKGLGDKLDDVGEKAEKAGKGTKSAAKEAEKLAKEAEKAGVSVEQLYKSFTVQVYVADQLALSLSKVNAELEKQKLTTQQYATWSSQYRDSLKKENELISEKSKNLKEQRESLQKQIDSGQIEEYGLISSEVQVPYYKYTANNLKDGKSGKASLKTGGLVGSNNEEKIWNYFKGLGFTDAAAAGAMGNFFQESGLNPAAKEVGGDGRGLAQWSFERRKSLEKYAKSVGKSWSDLQVQLDFMATEFENNYYKFSNGTKKGINDIKKMGSAVDASYHFQKTYEGAGVPNQANRNNAAKKYYSKYKGKGFISPSSNIVSGTQGLDLVDGATLNKDPWGAYGTGSGLGGAHYGRDISGYNVGGKSIRAAKAGVVTFAGWTGGGNTLSIFDGTNTYTYMHMQKPASVKKGATVKAGQVVGKVGTTHDRSLGGMSTGNHLHVQVNKGRTASGSSVDTFKGANAVIDPVKHGYVKVSGDGGYSSPAPNLGNMSSSDVDAYNASEEARLADIEAAIKQQNSAEAMKQKVDEATKRLYELQLEEVRTSNAKNENLYKIQKSHVEEYDYSKKLQGLKTAQLKYELDKIEMEKGRTSKEWQEKSKQVETSLALEAGFDNGKVKYINNALKDKSLFKKNSVYETEFKEMLAQGQQSIRDNDIARKQILSSIASSIIDSIMQDHENSTGKNQTTIANLNKQLEKLDKEDNSQAQAAINTTNSIIKQNQEIAKRTAFTIAQLNENAPLMSNYAEVSKRIKDQIKNLNAELEETNLQIYKLKIQAADMDIELTLKQNAERLEKASAALSKVSYKQAFINQDLQVDLWRASQVEQVKAILEQREALSKNKEELEKKLKLYKALPTQAKKLKDSIKDVTNAIQEQNKSVHTARQDLASATLQQIKTIYQKQLEVATKAYDDEYKAYEKMINKKLKLIDDEANDDAHKKEVENRTKAINKIREEIAQRSGDDSLSNKKKVKDLQEQLKQQEEEYSDYLKNKSRDERKQALSQELEDKRNQIDEQKEDLGKAFSELLEDTRRFNELNEQIMEGQVDKYKSLIEELALFVNDNMKDIGYSVGQNILDGMNETFKGLEALTSQLKADEKGKNPVPNSKLKPIKRPEITAAAIKAVNMLRPPVSVNSIKPLKLNTPEKMAQQNNVTNHNTTADALIKIDNFNGTQKEIDTFAQSVTNELRKQGIQL